MTMVTSVPNAHRESEGKRMPELQNEIPTDSDLREYFLEYFASTVTGEMFAPLKRAEGQELRAGCDRLIKKAGESIFASLQRLNRLDRTDPSVLVNLSEV